MWELNKNWIRVTREKNMHTFILDDAGNKYKKLITKVTEHVPLDLTLRFCSTFALD